jgi:hypothetical protein
MRQFAFAMMLAAGCAEAPPVKTTLPVHILKTPEVVTQNGVSLTVDPINYDNWKNHGQVVGQISWQEVDRSAPVMAGSGAGAARTVTRSDSVALVPLPALQVSISNQGPKPLDFAKARGELSDGQHHWVMFDSVGDVQGRVQSDIMGSHDNISNNHVVLENVANAVAQLPIASAKLTIAPGQTWQGYLTFKVEVHDGDEFNDFMANAEKLTLSLSGLGDANWSVVLVKETQQKQVTCPGDLKKPSLKKCKEG